MTDEPLCMICGESRVDASEEDEYGVWWTYCRRCDAWTEHPADGESGP